VAREQAGRVVDRIGGGGEGGGAHWKACPRWRGLAAGGMTSASRSTGHQRGPNGWGGSTHWRSAWGGI
jgi:hypothetical protein